jgi:hypothetical protein
LFSSMMNRMIIASKSIWNPCMDQKHCCYIKEPVRPYMTIPLQVCSQKV